MKTIYHVESHEYKTEHQHLLVVNLTPEYRWDQKDTVKKAIEQQLYDIFCKYTVR